MTIEFRCPNCQKLLRTSDEKAGRTAKCPDCGNPVKIPAADDEFGALEEDGPDEEVASRMPPARVARSGAGGADTKLCPMCGETIKAAATRCRYCGEDLAGGASYEAMPTQIDAGEVISTSWAIYKSQMGMLIGGFLIVGLIGGAASVPRAILQGMVDNGAFGRGEAPMIVAITFGLSIAEFVVQMFLTAGHNIFMLKVARGQNAEIADLFQGGPYLLRAIGNSLLFGLMVGLGTLALIVPGIILALMFWPFMYVLVDTNARGIDPLARAKEITASNWGGAFVLGLTAFGLGLLGLLMCCVGVVFTAPLASFLFAVAYCRMTGQPTARSWFTACCSPTVRALVVETGRFLYDAAMVRQPIIQRQEAAGEPNAGSGAPLNLDDRQYDDELRPKCLADVVGQRKVVERLQIMLNATRKRKEPLGHLLLDGPPGIGKTTLATVLPRELGAEIQMTSGPALSAPKDLLPYLTNATFGSVLFIDEIHRLPPAVEEFIYSAMEDFRIDITLGEGVNARTVSIPLAKFTLIGATTRSGMLTAPLRDRFVNREHLEFYESDDVADIVTRNARKLRTEIAPEAADEIARRSRGTPRKANNLLRWARDFATDKHADAKITKAIACDALAMKEIDDLGLEDQDRRYLRTLIKVFTGGPAGLNAIAYTMNISPDTLEDEVEPFLLRCGLIQRTPRGRMVTAAAFRHLDLAAPADPQGQLFE